MTAIMKQLVCCTGEDTSTCHTSGNRKGTTKLIYKCICNRNSAHLQVVCFRVHAKLLQQNFSRASETLRLKQIMPKKPNKLQTLLIRYQLAFILTIALLRKGVVGTPSIFLKFFRDLMRNLFSNAFSNLYGCSFTYIWTYFAMFLVQRLLSYNHFTEGYHPH